MATFECVLILVKVPSKRLSNIHGFFLNDNGGFWHHKNLTGLKLLIRTSDNAGDLQTKRIILSFRFFAIKIKRRNFTGIITGCCSIFFLRCIQTIRYLGGSNRGGIGGGFIQDNRRQSYFSST